MSLTILTINLNSLPVGRKPSVSKARKTTSVKERTSHDTTAGLRLTSSKFSASRAKILRVDLCRLGPLLVLMLDPLGILRSRRQSLDPTLEIPHPVYVKMRAVPNAYLFPFGGPLFATKNGLPPQIQIKAKKTHPRTTPSALHIRTTPRLITEPVVVQHHVQGLKADEASNRSQMSCLFRETRCWASLKGKPTKNLRKKTHTQMRRRLNPLSYRVAAETYKCWGYAGFSLVVHIPRCHFGYLFLSYRHDQFMHMHLACQGQQKLHFFPLFPLFVQAL